MALLVCDSCGEVSAPFEEGEGWSEYPEKWVDAHVKVKTDDYPQLKGFSLKYAFVTLTFCPECVKKANFY